MRLYEEAMELCAMMDRRTIPDGVGGFDYQWTEGAQFMAAVTKDTVDHIVLADKQDAKESYTVTVNKGLVLEFHDIFKRLSDGAIFRVTGYVRDKESPKRATFKIGTVSAERWELVGTEVQSNA